MSQFIDVCGCSLPYEECCRHQPERETFGAGMPWTYSLEGHTAYEAIVKSELPEGQSVDSAIRAMLGGMIRAYLDMMDDEEDSDEATLAQAANDLVDDEDEIHNEFEYNCPHCDLPS